jgi:Rad3-related DNA helicase
MSQTELDRCYDVAAPFLRSHDILPLKQNGSSLEEIREFNRNEYSVLFGVDRFWSGVDFPGSTLSQVIITKAPNPALNAPLIAHQKIWDPQFMQEKYPIYGRLRLRQGFGRLVRSITDKGGVIILDSRYGFNPWFSYHLDELPLEVLHTHDQEEIMRSVLRISGLKKEFHERRIDPFLEAEKFPFADKIIAPIIPNTINIVKKSGIYLNHNNSLQKKTI